MQHIILGEKQGSLFSAKNILFFAGNKLYLLSSWFTHYESDCDLILEILENNIKKLRIKKDIYSEYQVSKSEKLENDLRNSANDFYAATKKKVYETNYIYYDASGRMYAVQTLKPYKDAVLNATDLWSEFEDCKKFLIKNRLEYMVSQAEKLTNANIVYPVSDRVYMNKIDEVIKFINNQ